MKSLLEAFKNPVFMIEILTWVGAAVMWFVTMSGLPEDISHLNRRVDNVEERVRILEQNLEKNNTKTDLILSAVYELRATMLKK